MKAFRGCSIVVVALLLVVLAGCNALNDSATTDLTKEPALTASAFTTSYPLRASYTGTTTDAPHWYRPQWAGEWIVTERYVPYHVQQFGVAEDGYYAIYSVQDGYDGYLFVYEGTFDPANPLVGVIAVSDDYDGNRASLIELYLVTGKAYFIISSTFYADNDYFAFAGPFTNYIYGVGAVTLGEADPADATSDLMADVEQLVDAGVLKSGQAKGLLNPLENALRSLEKEYTSDACNQLADFIMEVEAKVPPLTETQADDLIGGAETIREMLACP
jgi:hypothetical protein